VRKEGNMLKKLKDNRGFTFIELLTVMIVLGILAQISLIFMLDLRSRSSDVMAMSDGRNLVTIARGNFVNLDDVKYDHNPGDGPNIGTLDTGNNPRADGPVFTLSPGVKAKITAGSESPGIPDYGFLEVWLCHEGGTKVGAAGEIGEGRKEYYYVVDELGADILATF
jgi:prepilin-type N-terminal cleavage/methylation domain-containing protein